MSIIIKRTINNATYLVESTSYRDKQGRPRTKQRCLGRLDDDGTFIPSGKKLPAEIREVKTVTRKFVVKKLNIPPQDSAELNEAVNREEPAHKRKK